MANALFDPAREGFLSGDINWPTATIKVALLRGYAFQPAHRHMSNVTGSGATVVAVSDALTGKTVVDGIADADSAAFGNVAAQAACEALLVFQSSAVAGGDDVDPSSQRLIAYLDSGTGLPVTPTGGQLTVSWSDHVFQL